MFFFFEGHGILSSKLVANERVGESSGSGEPAGPKDRVGVILKISLDNDIRDA